jgi:hypothetical protein
MAFVIALQSPNIPPPRFQPGSATRPLYAWTDLTYLLHRYGVSWGYYIVSGIEPDCENDAAL